ncbi:stretch-activated cation channel mid1 [Actinomortierella ambigua]|nr:stretch-activated cation channel mid1 [Actinomortierella ambigua]
MQRTRGPGVFRHKRPHRPWALLGITVLLAVLALPFSTAQPTTPSSASSSSPGPSSTAGSSAQPQPPPQPTASPTAPPPLQPQPLPPGTRELRDGIVLADMVTIGQGQTYHLSLGAQPQSLPVRRQLERIIHALPPLSPALPHDHAFDDSPQDPSMLEKRQAVAPAPNGTAATTITTTVATALPSPSLSPTRASSPSSAASPGPDGTYAVYISVSTCVTPKSSDPAAVCPPLILYVSTSTQIPMPGPGMNPDVVAMVTSTDGLIQYTAHATKDVFFSVYSPAMQGSWTGGWSIEVGASSQGYAQRYDAAPGLVLDDTDNTNASFLSHNFTVGSMPTFKVYLVPASQYPAGLSRSVCAIDAIQPLPLSKTTMTVSETNRTTFLDTPSTYGVLPGDPNPAVNGVRRQVRITSLQPGTSYLALFMTDVLQQSGAEVLYAMTPFKTKRDDNCLLLTDLSFCREVAYSVPVTPLSSMPGGAGGGGGGGGGGTTNASVPRTMTEVGKLYDDFARNLMDNFDKVLAQYDCTQSSYSLIRNCTDCSRAYRRWLCSVSIPRCTDREDVMDLTNNIGYAAYATTTPDERRNPYLKLKDPPPVVVPRNTSTSRGAVVPLHQAQNPLFNPGDYGEVLPCIDLCYDVVQSCPSFLGFGCPNKNMAGSYAPMRAEGFQCNGLGLVSLPPPPPPSSGAVATMITDFFLE